ncbi:hypothetical protein M426DRAFT_324788 [Hypoxylon sp. CI-4A]|nr:hypothetical protein M426DRAFT_324788 [Hypoxylon sp. CI-4A]
MSQKTIAFFGASTGVGLAALRHSLAAGRNCVALCRDPAKLSNIFSQEKTPNLKIVQGNAHDLSAVSQCLRTLENELIDEIVFTIGGKFILSKVSLDDPNVCEKGITTVLNAISELRKQGVEGRPHIIACSTTGFSRFGRDVPLSMVPFYNIALKVPAADKIIMEDKLATSNEDFTVVRASRLVDGETDNTIRVGIEDPKAGVEVKAIGYKISREDTGKWIAKNLISGMDGKYLNKNVTVTY